LNTQDRRALRIAVALLFLTVFFAMALASGGGSFGFVFPGIFFLFFLVVVIIMIAQRGDARWLKDSTPSH